MQVTATHDIIKLLDGYPGMDVTLARRKGNIWFVAGINAELVEKQKTIPLTFLPEGVRYQVTLIEDGRHDKALSARYLVVDNTCSISVRMLRRGGFIGYLQPMH